VCGYEKLALCLNSQQNASITPVPSLQVLSDTGNAAPTLTSLSLSLSLSLRERPSLDLQMADLKYGLVNIRADDEDLDAVDNQFTVSDFCQEKICKTLRAFAFPS
jgi:hypothetical protein